MAPLGADWISGFLSTLPQRKTLLTLLAMSLTPFVEKHSRRSVSACKYPVAQSFGQSQHRHQPATRNAHQGNDEGEPAGVGVRSSGREAAQQGLQQHRGQKP